MHRKIIILFTVFLFCSFSASATVDFLCVNHITKELYWGDEDHSPGFIGWEIIPDGYMERDEKMYLEVGYTFTENPFKIETGLFGLVVLVLAVGFGVGYVKRKKTRGGITS